MEKKERKCSCRKAANDYKCIKIDPNPPKSDQPLPNPDTQPSATPVAKHVDPIKYPIAKVCPCTLDLNGPVDYFSSALQPTRSSLEIAMEISNQKCQEKDKIIDAMVENLDLEQHMDQYVNIMHKAAAVGHVPDYGIMVLEQEVKKPGCSCLVSNESQICPLQVSESPLRISCLRRLSDTIWLLQWIPALENNIVGYEIYVNGDLTCGAFSDNSNAMIFSAKANVEKLQVNLIAVTPLGPCFPDAVAIAS